MAGGLCSREVRPCPWELGRAQTGVGAGAPAQDKASSVLIRLLGEQAPGALSMPLRWGASAVPRSPEGLGQMEDEEAEPVVLFPPVGQQL